MTCDDGEQSIRVLIADDDTRVRAALRTFLCAAPGFDVVGDAASAAAALDMATSRAPTVAVVDVLLPGEPDGLRVLRTLTRELGIPAIAISINGWVRDWALAAGAHEFLAKNDAADLLVAALRAAAAKRRPDGP